MPRIALTSYAIFAAFDGTVPPASVFILERSAINASTVVWSPDEIPAAVMFAVEQFWLYTL